MKYLNSILIILLIGAFGCTSKKVESESNDNDSEMVVMFNQKAERNPKAILEALTRDGLVKIDTLDVEQNGQVVGIIYFNGVGFAVTSHHDDDPAHGDFFHMLSSRTDDNAYLQVKETIEHYYGPMEEDEWHSALYSTPDAYFKIRPVHSEKGGLSMIWAY